VKKTTAAGYIADTREYPIRQNRYIQFEAQADRLATFLRDRFERIPCLFPINGAPAKPWLELGDRVTGQETDSGINHEAYIVGMSQRLDESHGYLMDLTLLEASTLYPISTYFKVGDDIENLDSFSAIVTDQWLGGTGKIKLAAWFIVADATFTARAGAVFLRRLGSPGGKIRLVLYTVSGGLPSSPLANGTSRWEDTGDVDTLGAYYGGYWHPFVFPDGPELVVLSDYYVVLEYDSDYTFSAGNAVSWRCRTIVGGGNMAKYSGATWSLDNNSLMPSMVYASPVFY